MARRKRRKTQAEPQTRSESVRVSDPQSTASFAKPTEPMKADSVEKTQRTWKDFGAIVRDRMVTEAFRILILSPVIFLLSPIVYVPCYRNSLEEARFTVDRRERVTKGSGDSEQSYYLVWSREGEVFCVADSWSFLSFDSSDRYGKLREGAQVEAKVAGWRVPFLSWYRNVIEITSTQP